MLIDITPVLNGDVNVIDIDYKLTMPEEYTIEDVEFPYPVKIKGSLRNIGGYMELKLKADVLFRTSCARCLEVVEDALTVDFTKGVAVTGELVNEDTDDYVIADDGMLDVDIPIAEEIMLVFPSRVLCGLGEDCKGLCPKCGKNLNEGDCGCDRREIDPRLEKLKQLLE